MDAFTGKRLIRFIEDFRAKTGQLPIFKDFEEAGFSKEVVKEATRANLIESFYVTLTNGTVVKGFKPVI